MEGRNGMLRLRILIPVIFVLVALLVLLAPRRGPAQLATNIPTPSPIPSPSPTPHLINALRSFHCNCTSAGNPVLWAGNVQATGYFQARQLASGQCLGYIGAKPVSPMVPTPNAAAALAVPTLLPLGVNPCANCACN
jgi:hypothetical protein